MDGSVRRLPDRPGRAAAIVGYLVPVAAAVVAAVLARPWWLPVLATALGFGLGLAAWTAGARRPGPASRVPPTNLPPPPPQIAGRADKIEELRQFLADPRRHGPRIANICGVAGIGKTALALYVAHQNAKAFAAGALFARFDADVVAEDAELVLRSQFIGASGRSGHGDATEDADAVYRRMTHRLTRRRRLLLVLDDINDLDAARRRLPASRWCSVIITSRRPLGDPSVLDVKLDELAEEQAIRLLWATIGWERAQREPGAARSIVRRAAGHPLAIQLVGMALANRPNMTLSLAERRMTDAAGERAASVDNALDLSYAMLTRGEQEALTALGLLDRRRFAPWELGALLGRQEREAWQYCDRLVDAGLLERYSTDAVGVQFYRVLEHVKDYARRRTPVTDEALAQARRLLAGERDNRLRRPAVGVFEDILATMELGSISSAFKQSRDAVALARERDDPASEAEATVMLAELHTELGGFDDVLDLLALPLIEEIPAARARAHRIRAKLHRRLRQVADARRELEQARLVFKRYQDPVEQARMLRESAVVEWFGGDPHHGLRLLAEARALGVREPALQASLGYTEGRIRGALGRDELIIARGVLADGLEIARENRQRLWEAWIRYELAENAYLRGRYQEAITEALETVESFEKMRHRYGGAHCRLLIGGALLASADAEHATRYLAEALETFHNCGDGWMEATAAEGLAAVHRHLGNHGEAAVLLAAAQRAYLVIGALDKAGDVVDPAPALHTVGDAR